MDIQNCTSIFFIKTVIFALNFDLFFKSQYVSLYNLNICYRYKEKQKVVEVAENITDTPEEKEVLNENPVSCKKEKRGKKHI